MSTETSEPDPAERAALGAALAATPETPRPSLYDLWRQAGGNTGQFDRQKYLDLMLGHGHLVGPGEDRSEEKS